MTNKEFAALVREMNARLDRIELALNLACKPLYKGALRGVVE